jgi:hypothetical protein
LKCIWGTLDAHHIVIVLHDNEVSIWERAAKCIFWTCPASILLISGSITWCYNVNLSISCCCCVHTILLQVAFIHIFHGSNSNSIFETIFYIIHCYFLFLFSPNPFHSCMLKNNAIWTRKIKGRFFHSHLLVCVFFLTFYTPSTTS